MPKFAIKHQESDDELDPKELVGSKDLRESFQDGQRVRGSFYLNGVHFHNFEANSPASIVAGINAKSASTGIKASIDDGGHLVLLNSSQMDIRIKLGAVYDEPASVSTGNVADDVVKMLKADRDIREGDHNDKRNNVLEQLGLEANEDDSQIAANRPGFETGMTAEQRADARANGNVTGDETAYSNNPSAPVTGAEGGKLRDGNDRSGTGYGYSPQPDGTPAVPGTPQNPGGGRNANPNAPRQSPPSRI